MCRNGFDFNAQTVVSRWRISRACLVSKKTGEKKRNEKRRRIHGVLLSVVQKQQGNTYLDWKHFALTLGMTLGLSPPDALFFGESCSGMDPEA